MGSLLHHSLAAQGRHIDPEHFVVWDNSDRRGITLKADVISTGDWRGIAANSDGGSAVVTSGYPDPVNACVAALQMLVERINGVTA